MMMRLGIVSAAVATMSVPPSGAIDLNESFPVGAGGTLRIYLDRGRVNVRRHDGPDVRIEAQARGLSASLGGFTAERSGNDVTVEGVFRWGFLLLPWGPRVTVNAWVPDNYSVGIETRGGAITIDGVRGLVVAHSGGGQIEAQHIAGNVSVQTSGGRLDVADVEGSVVAETSGGRIAASDIRGNIEVKTSGGAIELDGVDGRIEASTSGGAINASFSDAPEGIIQTSGGTITVSFPERSQVDLDAKTNGGSVSVDHRIDASEQDRHHVVGRINGGGPMLRLRTSGGNIQVRAT